MIDYLLSREVKEMLAFCPSIQMPLRENVDTPDNFITISEITPMNIDYEKMADVLESSVMYVQALFIIRIHMDEKTNVPHLLREKFEVYH